MKLQPKYADLILNLLVAVAISLVVNFSYVLLMLVDLNSDNQPRPAGERIVERTDEGVLAVHPDGYGYLVYENGDSVYVPSRRMRWLGIAPGDQVILKGVRTALEQGAEDFQATLVQQGQEKTVTLRLPAMTEEEREVILSGCLINYYAK